MIDSRMLREIQGAPVEERLHLIEIILQSLKKDIETTSPAPKKCSLCVNLVWVQRSMQTAINCITNEQSDCVCP